MFFFMKLPGTSQKCGENGTATYFQYKPKKYYISVVTVLMVIMQFNACDAELFRRIKRLKWNVQKS